MTWLTVRVFPQRQQHPAVLPGLQKPLRNLLLLTHSGSEKATTSVVSPSADMWCHGLDTSRMGTKPTALRAFSTSYSFWVRSESPG